MSCSYNAEYTLTAFSAQGTCLYAILLTASNPLTILFWAGVFSGKVAELAMKKKDVCLYGMGAMLSTLVFLSAIALVGSLAGAFLPGAAIAVLNVAAGVLLVFFGVKMAIGHGRKQPQNLL